MVKNKMMHIIIGLIMMVIGLFGLIKYKFPKYEASASFGAYLRVYLAFIALLVFGLLLLVKNIGSVSKMDNVSEVLF